MIMKIKVDHGKEILVLNIIGHCLVKNQINDHAFSNVTIFF